MRLQSSISHLQSCHHMVTSCVTIPFPLPPPPSVTTTDVLQHWRWVYHLRRPPSTLPTATSPPERCQWRMAEQMRDSAHATYSGMGTGKCKLPHDPITVETTHPHHRSSSPNDANKDPCTQIGERGCWEIVGCQRTREGQCLWALSNQ